jgi:hypothetical protein
VTTESFHHSIGSESFVTVSSGDPEETRRYQWNKRNTIASEFFN